jgi:membrane protease YdiL (CAAX protease family)
VSERPPGFARAVWLLVRLELGARLNRFSAGMMRLRRYTGRAKTKGQLGPRSLRRHSSLLARTWPLLFILMMLFGWFMISFGLVGRLAWALGADNRIAIQQKTKSELWHISFRLETLSDASAGETAWSEHVEQCEQELREIFRREAQRQFPRDDQKAQAHYEEMLRRFHSDGEEAFRNENEPPMALPGVWPPQPRHPDMLLAMGLLLTAATIANVLTSLGSAGELHQLGPVEEWLFSFPVRPRVLAFAQILREALNPQLWMFVFPLLSLMFFVFGWVWAALPLAFAGSLYLGLLGAAVSVLLKVFLRKRMRPNSGRAIQAVSTLSGFLVIFLFLGVSVRPAGAEALAAVAEALPHWLVYLPTFLPAAILGSPAAGVIAAATGLLLASGITLLVMRWYEQLLKDGLLVEGGAAMTNHPDRLAAGAREVRPTADWWNGIVGREARGILRDRRTIAALLAPPVVVTIHLMITPTGELLRNNTVAVPAVAFSAGALVLLGTLSLLAGEGNALWILHTFPHKLGPMLRRKLLPWLVMSGVASLAVLAVILLGFAQPSLAQLPALVAAVAGLGVVGFVCSGIGVLASRLDDPQPTRGVKLWGVWASLFLISMYASILYTSNLWQMLGSAVMFAAVAAGIWQIVDDRLPHICDPDSRPSPRLLAADGLIAGFCFMVIQGLLATLLASAGLALPVAVTTSYIAAGALVTGSALLILHRRRIPSLWRSLGLGGRGSIKAVVVGAATGVALGALGAAYLAIVNQVEPMRRLKESMPNLLATSHGQSYWVLVVLVVALAPLVEELIFRGLIFQGLERLLRPWQAVALAAALFALVHPPISVIPTFLLGLAACLLMRRTRLLAAPIAAHAVYNGLIILAGSMM